MRLRTTLPVCLLAFSSVAYATDGLDLLLKVYEKYEIEQPPKNKVYHLQYVTKTISKQAGKPFESEGTFDVWVSALQMRVKGLDMESYRSDKEVISVDRRNKEIMIADSKTTLFNKNRRLKLAELTTSFLKDCSAEALYRLENDNYPASKGDYVLLLKLSEQLQSYTMISSLLYTIRAKDSTICTFTINYTASNPDFIRTDIWYKELSLSEGQYKPVEQVLIKGKGAGEYAAYALTDSRKKRKNK